MLPGFLIIGAPRCGTDFLFYNLAAHPQVCAAKEREIHFFDQHFDKGLKWYEQFFSECTVGQIPGEKTAHYFVDPVCAKRIKESLGDVKLILSLRDPVERAYSHYRNWLGWGDIETQMSFRECCENKPLLLNMGKYYHHLNNYLQFFAKENVHVLFLEQMIASPDKEYKRVLQFLEIDHTFQIPYQRTFNVPRKIYKKGEKRFSAKKYKILDAVLPDFLLRGIFDIQEFKVPPLSKEDRNFLQEYYAEYNEKLFEILGRKTPIWPF